MVNITNQLARFLPPQVWQPIIHKQSLVEASSRRKITILFSDIVGFTDLSDKISADHLAHILNTYLDRMTQITPATALPLTSLLVTAYCATLVIRAIIMSARMPSVARIWRLKCVEKCKRYVSNGDYWAFEGLYVRMGINTGYCYVGNFGSHNRMTYTVIENSQPGGAT